MKFNFEKLQSLGKALMLPIAVLPIAGLLLRFGQADLLNLPFVANAGNTIFAHLPVLFAIGIAVGLSKDNHGAAGLAGYVGYLIMVAVMNTMDPTLDCGVFGGIIIGLTAAALYNKYRDIELPKALAFFGGRRFIPIVTGISAIFIGAFLGYAWSPIGNGISVAAHGIESMGAVGLFIYGVVQRILLIFGLHHIWNSYFWFMLGDFTNTAGVDLWPETLLLDFL